MKVNKKIRILHVDDSPVFRLLTGDALSFYDDIELVGECSDGSFVHEFLNNNQVDIILMDITMGIIDGIETTKMVSQTFPEVKIIALTSHNEKAYRNAMSEAGVSAYLLKHSNASVIMNTINKLIGVTNS